MSRRILGCRAEVARKLDGFYRSVLGDAVRATLRGQRPNHMQMYADEREVYDHLSEVALLEGVREIAFLRMLYAAIQTLFESDADLLEALLSKTRDNVLCEAREWAAGHREIAWTAQGAADFVDNLEIDYSGSHSFGYLLRPCVLVMALGANPRLIDGWSELYEHEPHRFFSPAGLRAARDASVKEADMGTSHLILDLLPEEIRGRLKEIRSAIRWTSYVRPTMSRGDNSYLGDFRLRRGACAFWTETPSQEMLMALNVWARPWVFGVADSLMHFNSIVRLRIGKPMGAKSQFRLNSTQFKIIQKLLDAHSVNQYLVPWLAEGSVVRPRLALRRGFNARTEGDRLFVSDRNGACTEYSKRSFALNSTADLPFLLAVLDLWAERATVLVSTKAEQSPEGAE